MALTQTRRVADHLARPLQALCTSAPVVLLRFNDSASEEPWVLCKSIKAAEQYFASTVSVRSDSPELHEEHSRQNSPKSPHRPPIETPSTNEGPLRVPKRKRGNTGTGGISTTNNNGRRERRRRNEEVDKLLSAFRDTAGVSVGAESLMDTTLRQYGPWFAWLGAQPGLQSLHKENAGRLVLNAAAIGGPAALSELRAVMRCWRERGALTAVDHAFSLGNPGNRMAPSDASQVLVHLSSQELPVQTVEEAVDRLCDLYQTVERVEAFSLLQKLYLRLRLARLYAQYEQAVQLITTHEEDSRVLAAENGRLRIRPGTLARDALFRQFYERIHGQTYMRAGSDRRSMDWAEVFSQPEVQRTRQQFDRKLVMGGRWFRFMEQFGRFAFLMVPDDVISESWIQRRSEKEFTAWLGLIKQFNPNVQLFGEDRFEGVVNGILQGGAPPTQVFQFESVDEDTISGIDCTELLEYTKD